MYKALYLLVWIDLVYIWMPCPLWVAALMLTHFGYLTPNVPSVAACTMFQYELKIFIFVWLLQLHKVENCSISNMLDVMFCDNGNTEVWTFAVNQWVTCVVSCTLTRFTVQFSLFRVGQAVKWTSWCCTLSPL